MRSHWSIVRLPSPPLVGYTTLVTTNLCPVIKTEAKPSVENCKCFAQRICRTGLSNFKKYLRNVGGTVS